MSLQGLPSHISLQCHGQQSSQLGPEEQVLLKYSWMYQAAREYFSESRGIIWDFGDRGQKSARDFEIHFTLP